MPAHGEINPTDSNFYWDANFGKWIRNPGSPTGGANLSLTQAMNHQEQTQASQDQASQNLSNSYTTPPKGPLSPPGGALKDGLVSTPPASNPSMSPEANAAANAGSSSVATPGGNPPATPTVGKLGRQAAPVDTPAKTDPNSLAVGASPLKDSIAKPMTLNQGGDPSGFKSAPIGTVDPNMPLTTGSMGTTGVAPPSTPDSKSPVSPPGQRDVNTPPPTGTPNPNVPPSASNAPLQLSGKTNVDQAKAVGEYLRQLGIPVSKFTVGGTSQYDSQINGLIDQINNPNTPDAQRRLLATNLGQLITLRSNSVTGAEFDYDPATGNLTAPSAKGGTGTDLVSQLNTQTPAKVTPDRSKLYGLIDQFASGGTAAGPEAALSKSRLVNDLENSESTQRQQLAERLGGANGAGGGYLQDQLLGLERGNQEAKASGFANIELGLLDRQQTSKQQALTSLLQTAGLDEQSAQQMASMINQRQIAAAQEAIRNEQFNSSLSQTGQIATSQLDLQQRGQDINSVIALLQLAAQGDEAAAKRAMEILTTLGGV